MWIRAGTRDDQDAIRRVTDAAVACHDAFTLARSLPEHACP
jgi:hypothetical protein